MIKTNKPRAIAFFRFYISVLFIGIFRLWFEQTIAITSKDLSGTHAIITIVAFVENHLKSICSGILIGNIFEGFKRRVSLAMLKKRDSGFLIIITVFIRGGRLAWNNFFKNVKNTISLFTKNIK